MQFSLKEMFSMAFVLFLLMDSIGNVPLFVAILKDTQGKRQLQIIFRELVIALGIIIVFYFVGNALLQFLHVSMTTLLISGGVILFLISLKMIFPDPDKQASSLPSREPLIVPLATPLIAGPAVLAAVILYSGQTEFHWGVTIMAIVLAWGATTAILMSAVWWKKWLGTRGLMACEKLMGLVLTLIAVQMFLEGIASFVNGS